MILRLRDVRILDDEFHGLLQALCGLRGRGGVFMACAQNPGVCEQLLRFLALQELRVAPVAAGVGHICAIRADGELFCFGRNGDGQCDVPPDMGPVVAVAARNGHTCAVKANENLVCWGHNEDGQCDVPPNLGPVVAVAAGGFHTCAVKANGDLVCFGNHECGQCDAPPDLGPVVTVAAGAMRFGSPRHAPHDSGCLLLPASQGQDPASPTFAAPVVQQVHHSGPAALIPADEAAAIVAQQEASFIEHNVNSVAWGAPATAQLGCRVVLLHFSRAPAEMRDALQHSEGLRAVLHELEQAGLDWMLPSGTKILVPPHVYHMLLRHLNCNPALQQQLCSSHFLVSEELEAVVMAAVRQLPSKLQVRLADYDTFTLSDAASSADSACSMAASGSMEPWGWSDGDLVVSRTFLELRPEDIPDAVTQSTSQARPGEGYGSNPRLAASRAELI